MRKEPIRNVEIYDVFYLDLRYWGYDWFDALDLPNAYVTTYVVQCEYVAWVTRRRYRFIQVRCPLLMKCCSRYGTITTSLHLVLFVSSPRRARWLLKSFVYFTLLYSLSAIGIGYLMSSPLVFNLNLTIEGGKGERALLQHRQLHRIFWTILCTAIYLLYYACPSMPLCVSLDCSVDGVPPPSGAIRNRRPIL